MDDASINFHVVSGRGLDAEVQAGLTVDRYAAIRDQLVAMTARTDAGSGKETVQAHGEEDVISDW
jgi:hypothetical protein